MLYHIDIRCYTMDADDDYCHDAHDLVAAHKYLCKQRGFGPFRAWVNGTEIKNAYHGISLDDLTIALDPLWGNFAKAFGEAFTPRITTNPATLQAKGVL